MANQQEEGCSPDNGAQAEYYLFQYQLLCNNMFLVC